MEDKSYYHGGAFVNPFTDGGFKIVFGSPDSKPVLVTLLNELLRGEHEISDLTYIDKEDHSDSVSDLLIMYDLLCRTSAGEYVIVEMQSRRHTNFLDRTLVYVCRALCRQNALAGAGSREDDMSELKRRFGDRYGLKTVYGIFLMNFRDPGLEEKFRTDVVLSDRETGRVVNGHLRQIFLQFPLFDKREGECSTLYDKLIYAIKNMGTMERMPDTFDEQVFTRLAALASKANLSLRDRMAYEDAADRYYYTMITKEEIREQGRKEGREQGREEGREQGVLLTARNFKALGVSCADIAKATGLPEDVIARL